jgi:hypothetical protein
METVSFIHTEDGTDLILAFAIADEEAPGEIISLTLLRTPELEFIFEPEERGVTVSREDIPESERDLLRSIRWKGDSVQIATADGRRYALDCHRLATEDVREAKRILERMHFDDAFEIDLAEADDTDEDSTFLA